MPRAGSWPIGAELGRWPIDPSSAIGHAGRVWIGHAQPVALRCAITALSAATHSNRRHPMPVPIKPSPDNGVIGSGQLACGGSGWPTTSPLWRQVADDRHHESALADGSSVWLVTDCAVIGHRPWPIGQPGRGRFHRASAASVLVTGFWPIDRGRWPTHRGRVADRALRSVFPLPAGGLCRVPEAEMREGLHPLRSRGVQASVWDCWCGQMVAARSTTASYSYGSL